MARVLVVLAALALAAPASSSTARLTATAVCATHSFTMTFDPKRKAVVTDGTHVLASGSFTSRAVSSGCRRGREPQRFLDGGLGPEIRARTSFRCLAIRPIRV